MLGKSVLQSAYSANIPAQKYRDSHPELVSGSTSNGRNERGTEIGTRYRYIDDTPLVPMTEAGKANGTNAASSASSAKTRSRPNNEYVLYSYGEPVAMSADGNASYFGTDILGSVRSVTDKYGAVQADYSYDVFGSPYLGNLENDIGFGYCGKVYDVGTGLYDYGFRDYSPISARFTTVDPIRGGSNWFSYVVNDPVNYCDPFGLTATDSKGGNVTFNQNVFSNPFVGYNEPQVTFETSSQTNNSYYGIDIGNSITVACGSMSTIGNCFGSKANKGFSLNNGTILGHNDVYIGGQNNETQSSNLIKQASMEMFIGILLDNGSPLIGGAFAYVTGGSSLLAIPVIKTIGISLQIDAAAKLTLAAIESTWDDYDNDDSPRTERIGKSRGNAPRNNQVQNEQVKAIAKDYNLTKDEQKMLHKLVNKQGYGYSEIEKIAQEIVEMRK